MRFRIEQDFAAPVDTVVAALVDPSYWALMEQLRDISAPEVRSQSRDGTMVRQELLFRFTGRLPGVVTRVIDPAKLSWTEFDDVDLVARRCQFAMVPVHYEKFFRCDGSWTITERSTTEARRVIEGDLRVNSPVPFVGGQVEKAIVSGLRERLHAEPAVFATWYQRG